MMRFATFFILSLFVGQSNLSQAANEGTQKMPELTKEERTKHADRMDKMAEAHKKMAECLRSDKPMSECHEEMKKECPMANSDHCPMMEEMHGMRGMHPGMHGKGRRMKGNTSNPEKKE